MNNSENAESTENVETTAKKVARPKDSTTRKKSAGKESMMYVGPTRRSNSEYRLHGNAGSARRSTEGMSGIRQFISANHEVCNGRADDPKEKRVHLYSV